MTPRLLLSCSFRPRTPAAVPLLDELVGGDPDPGHADPATGVVTRGWTVRGRDRASAARDRLAGTPGVWGVTLDDWPARGWTAPTPPAPPPASPAPRVWVPGRLAPDLSLDVTNLAGRVVRVAGPVGCLDGAAAVLGRVLERHPGGVVRVGFRGGVEVVVRVESAYA